MSSPLLSTIRASPSSSITASNIPSMGVVTRFDTLSMSIAADKPAVVIDIGSAFTKCGFAGEYTPRAIIRSQYIDVDLCSYRPFVSQRSHISPTRRDAILLRFLRQIYFRHLLAVPRERRVVIVESVLTSTDNRQSLARLLFDVLDVPSILFAPSHLMATLPYGAQTALVIDVGYRETLVLPISESLAMLNNWEASPNGGICAVYDRIRSMLVAKSAKVLSAGGNVSESIELHRDLLDDDQLIEDICVRLCFVTTIERGRQIQLAEHDSSISPPSPPIDVRLPVSGSRLLIVPGSIRESAAEILFEYNFDVSSLPQLILDCLLRCPIDLRRPLAEHLLIVGGGALLTGFMPRIQQELIDLLTNHNRYRDRLPLKVVKFIRFNDAPIESYASWLGGSLFGSLEVLPYRSLTRDEWQRNGRRVPDWTAKIADSCGIDENTPPTIAGDAAK